MAKNITLLGANYTAVPGVNLPQTGGGTAYFADTSPTTAIEEDVAQGKIFFLDDGTQATGTASAGSQLTLVVSVTSGATVTATKGSTSVSGTSVSGSCTLTLPEAGTWSVSAVVSGNSTGTRTVVVQDTYNVTLYLVGSDLNATSWSVITSVSNADEGPNYWSIGDRKSVSISGTVGNFTFSSVTSYAFIIGFDHNSYWEGNKRIHFQFGATAKTGGKMVAFIDSKYNSSVSSIGYFSMSNNGQSNAWSASQMRTTICTAFVNALPSALKSALKTVVKYTHNVNSNESLSRNVTPAEEIIFLLSEKEVFGTITKGNTYEGTYQEQYAYYAAGNSKVRYRHSSTGSTAIWLLRSAFIANTGQFCRVNTGGTIGNATGNYSYGFAPAFCV